MIQLNLGVYFCVPLSKLLNSYNTLNNNSKIFNKNKQTMANII